MPVLSPADFVIFFLYFLPLARMRSRVMHLVVSVCVCVYMWPRNWPGYCLTKILLSVYYLIMEFKLLKSGFYAQRVVQTKQFILCSIKACHIILHYGVPCLIVIHYATCVEGLPPWDRQHVQCMRSYRWTACAVQFISLHVQQSSDSAFCAHRVCVLWNSCFFEFIGFNGHFKK